MITQYLKESAAQEKIDQKIKYRHTVDRMSWSTSSRTWALDITIKEPQYTTRTTTLRSRFILLGTGYYDYHEPMKADIPGIQDFQGPVIHPQFWPEDLDYINKNITIIGSGATAITLLPSLTHQAAHVTMLQRSPSYIASLENSADAFDRLSILLWPRAVAARLIRFKWILVSFLMVTFCQWFPRTAKKLLLAKTQSLLPEGMETYPDFTPSYNPWEQRMCMCPDGDFYRCLREGKASVATGIIDAVTAKGIRLTSGVELHPDIIVTATGLKVRMGGGIQILVDGKPFHLPDHFMWKGAMIEDLPNLVLALGYVDASWTLGAEATAQLACRLLSRMKSEAVDMIVPRLTERERANLTEVPLLYLTSTYVDKGLKSLPKASSRGPWQRRSYYWKDLFMARWGSIRSGLQWIK